jgi:hypothetical protein
MSRQSEPARGGTPACPWPDDQVERWPSERCPRATWQASIGRVAIHQAPGQSFDERAASQAVQSGAVKWREKHSS